LVPSSSTHFKWYLLDLAFLSGFIAGATTVFASTTLVIKHSGVTDHVKKGNNKIKLKTEKNISKQRCVKQR
jgi:hypothetical protein